MPKGAGRGRGGIPPVEYRWAKGQSGNPNGRPPKPRSDSIAELVRLHLLKKVSVIVNGKRRTASLLELGLEKFANDFVTGTATERRKALESLLKTGLLDGIAEPRITDPRAIEKFVEQLAEEARRDAEWDRGNAD